MRRENYPLSAHAFPQAPSGILAVLGAQEGTMAGRFDGKVVVITGGGGGIGRATAVRLAGEGARLVLVDRVRDALAASVSAVEGAGSVALSVEADVTRRTDVERY